MRRTRRQDRKRDPEPGRCRCSHVADTPEYVRPSGRGAGLTGRHAANHGNPFAHTGCQHSELNNTTKPAPKKQTVARIRL